MAVIEIENIARHFYVGNETIKALKKIDISIEKNEFVERRIKEYRISEVA